MGANTNFAQEIGEWLLKNIAWIFLVAGICAAGLQGIKRNVTGALITLGVTALAFIIALNAEEIFKLLGGMFRSILGI